MFGNFVNKRLDKTVSMFHYLETKKRQQISAVIINNFMMPEEKESGAETDNSAEKAEI